MHLVVAAPPKSLLFSRHSRLALLFTAATMALGTATTSASASDYFHECDATSVGTGYRLTVKKRKYQLRKSGSAAQIKYKLKKKTALRELSGICVGRKRRYRYETVIYLLDLEIKVSGQTKPLQFRCEKSVDATPAGVKCVREIKLIDWQSPSIGQKQ